MMTSVSPAGPCVDPVISLRAPVASMSVTVSVSSGTDVSNDQTIEVGATVSVAPSAGSLPRRVLCASAVPDDISRVAASAASATKRRRGVFGRGMGCQKRQRSDDQSNYAV